MTTTSSLHRRIVVGTLALAMTAGLGAITATTAEASASSTQTPATSGPITHPQDDHLGSTIPADSADAPSAFTRSVAIAATSSTGSSAIASRPSGNATSGNSADQLRPPRPLGLDVASWEGNVDWSAVASHGASFAYVKATEGVTYTNPYYPQQYNGAASAGLIRGAYHFALPDRTDGKTQADFLLANGGMWVRDGKTLPPMLDLEYNPYGETCYGLTPAALTQWVLDFSNEVKAKSGRFPTIYTPSAWWNQCTGGATTAGGDPLVMVAWGGKDQLLPASWPAYTVWQYMDTGLFPGDQDVFNGTLVDLYAFALNLRYTPAAPLARLWPTLQEGDSGPAVRELKDLLNSYGYGLTEDSTFDAATTAAVRAFQAQYKKMVSGIADQATWQSMAYYVNLIHDSTGSPDAIKAAQVALNQHGYPVPVDGTFSVFTQVGLRAFQLTHGVPADGYLNSPTLLALIGT